MKKLLFSLFLPVASLGQEPVKSDVDVLTENYTRAVERATKTITNTYQEELKKLLKKYSEKGDIKNVEKITDILKQYEKPVVSINTKYIKLIEDHAWKTPYGSTFYFEKGGTGYKMTGSDRSTFMWKFIEDDIIEWTGRRISSDNIINNYIKINSDGTMKIGPSKDKIDVDFIFVK